MPNIHNPHRFLTTIKRAHSERSPQSIKLHCDAALLELTRAFKEADLLRGEGRDLVQEMLRDAMSQIRNIEKIPGFRDAL